MICALIPAAGKSTRMGRPKLALPLGKKTVLEHVIAALGQAGIEHILVVIGPHVSELVPLAEQAGASALLLQEETADMQATVLRGLAWLEARFQPNDGDSWLLVPADQPTLDASLVRQLIKAATQAPEYSIAIPTFEGKRGHPALIRWKQVRQIKALPAGQGLNIFLRQHQAVTLEVPVPTRDILIDLNTPEDYAALQQRF
jgi:molybdenum cofactor cytidylyltransferase